MMAEGFGRPLVTVADYITWGALEFEAAGLHFGQDTADAVDEAAALVFHALSLSHEAVPAAYDRQLGPGDREAVERLLERRIRERRPGAYLTGRTWFAGLEFVIDERALIPRSPLAEWIERGFAPWLDPERVDTVLDLCTGSGCIAVACAHVFARARVDAVDISPDALQLAAENIDRHDLTGRVRTFRSHLFEGLPPRRYDLIVGNPPYVPNEALPALPAEYGHEPRLALAGGTDGLDLVREIILVAADYLAPTGILVVEVGDARDRLEALYPDLPFLWLDFERGEADVFLLSADELARLKAR